MSCCNTCYQPVKTCCCPTPAPVPVPPTPTPLPECISPFDYLFSTTVVTSGPCVNTNCKTPMEYFFEQAIALAPSFAQAPAAAKEGDISVQFDLQYPLVQAINFLLENGLVVSNDSGICCENCCLENNNLPYFLGNQDVLYAILNNYNNNNFPCCLNVYGAVETILKVGIELPPACTQDFQSCVIALLAQTDAAVDFIADGIFESGNSQSISYICTLGNILAGLTPPITSAEYTEILRSILEYGFVVSCNTFDDQIFIGGVNAYQNINSEKK